MNQRGKRILIFFCATILIIGVWLIEVAQRDNGYVRVKEGITRTEAERFVNEDEQCFLIAAKDGGTGTDFSIVYGEYSGSDVVLTGNTPKRSLSNVFFLSKQNTFLVKGIEYNISSRGLPFYMDASNNYSIDVISWEIVIPIRRDYQYRTNEQKERLFSPSNYLDQFDVEQRDYIDNFK